MCRRYEGLGRVCKSINPPNDLHNFIKTLSIPESIAISRHNYSIPQGAKDVPPVRLSQVKKRRDVSPSSVNDSNGPMKMLV